MDKIVLSLFLALQVINVNAQYNLVPNPSFEVFDTCPNSAGQIHHAIPWMNPLYFTSPDYMNACDTTGMQYAGVPSNLAGYEFARTGSGYAHIVTYHHGNTNPTNSREYIETILTDSLTAGTDYCIRFFVSAGDSARYFSNNIGIYFSPTEINDTCSPIGCILLHVPQFENQPTNNLSSNSGWTEISGNYTAVGGEKYIVIGNFRDTASTIATYTGWSANLIYNVALYYIDDVLITPCDSITGIENDLMLKKGIKLFPTPSKDEVNIESQELITQIDLFSIIGEIGYKEIIISAEKKIKVDISLLSNGIYIIRVTTSKKIFNLKFIKN